MKLIFMIGLLAIIAYQAFKNKDPYWCFLTGWQVHVIATEIAKV